jgi:hypothetical protein
VGLQTLKGLGVATAMGWGSGSGAVRRAWKRTERARARVFFEFMVWLLHPSPLVLFIFWPGWIFVFMGMGYYYYC